MGMAFVSYNKADRETARTLAIALVEQGMGVWYDEWEIAPGTSITGGIEAGLTTATAFVLLWSAPAAASNWVKTETRAYLRRRVEDQTLRVVPVMLDDTPLPTLVADYSGFKLGGDTNLVQVASRIAGTYSDRELARRLQDRLFDLADRLHADRPAPLPYLVCPQCGSPHLRRSQTVDERRDDIYLCINCTECHWHDDEEIF